ncbi:RecB family nuclease, putative, TM0106 family [Corynebacterium mustelae]|uniref:RecB family nuclease, putative, TM0106 family n=1 Tax=Corynebacterium mustelae TaxID=571915 RepID=A0A0G3H3D1_9CORY|nr:TM0106 family RecB-like putative nuclease [Corynebacterium mustelae]AKK07255.1 RecB family nuclease, putative, TM0106 family [Corynebacterium mustelae]
MEIDTYLQPSDLVGCRYRLHQRTAYPTAEPTAATISRRIRLDRTRKRVLSLIPTKPQIGDPKNFLRIDLGRISATQLEYSSRQRAQDLERRWFATLEALAAGANIITDPVVETRSKIRMDIDALIRRPDGAYMPVVVTNHRVAREDNNRTVNVIATRRLGLGKANAGNYRLKHHAVDSYTLALSVAALDELGVGVERGVLIGQNHELAFIVDTSLFRQGLNQALMVETPTTALRVKDCASCRYWSYCHAELQERDDISLLFSGDKGARFRDIGFPTVSALARVEPPYAHISRDDIVLARAYTKDIALVKRNSTITAPKFDIEIDIDVEAYLDQGAYLWGAFDGQKYHPFVTWNELGSLAEAKNFARFWSWLKTKRRQAHDAGKSIGIFCYSNHGENHWLRFSARRFYAKYRDQIPELPSESEVAQFINSPEWIDVFALVRAQLLGVHGLGLKVVAPAAGFSWEEDEVDGEASVGLYLAATGAVLKGDIPITTALVDAQAALLSYNGDDCRATRAVRHFLVAGAPGVPTATEL